MRSISLLFAARTSIPTRAFARKSRIPYGETTVMNFEHDIPNTSCKLTVAVETTYPSASGGTPQADVKFAISCASEESEAVAQNEEITQDSTRPGGAPAIDARGRLFLPY